MRGSVIRTLILTLALLLSAACSPVPSLDEAEAAEVVREARELMSSSKEGESISADRWPAAIRRLDPNSVRVDKEGLYIVTYTLYVEEQGLFVPREPSTFVAEGRFEPSFGRMHPSLFSYRIAG